MSHSRRPPTSIIPRARPHVRIAPSIIRAWLGRAVLALVMASAAATAAETGGSAPLQLYLIELARVKAGAPVQLRLGKDVLEAELVAADDKGLRIKATGFETTRTWAQISDEDLYTLCTPSIKAAMAPAQAAYLALAARLGHDSGKAFDDLLGELAKRDAKAAAEVIALRGTAHPAPAAAKEPADGAEPAAGEEEAPPGGDKWSPSLLDKTGKVNRALYAREARAWSTQVINRRLGPDYDFYHKGKKETFPTVWMPPSKLSKAGRNGIGFNYQVGGPPNPAENNDYGSTVGQVFYIPDKPNDPGVDRISTHDFLFHVLVTTPEPVWWGGSHPDPVMVRPEVVKINGGPPSQGVAMARSYEANCMDNDSIMLFTSGLMACSGTQTSDDHFPAMMFPPHKVPTAVAVTNFNEFALVTIWDTKECKGQVAVVACASQGLPLFAWPYFGLANNASYGRFKLLGYIDIPGMIAPTTIAAASNNRFMLLPGGQAMGKLRLDAQDMRDRFLKGDLKDYIASNGVAVVLSRSEGKAAFIDLQPLFDYMRMMYLTTPENFAKTKDEGPEPKQWPPAFEVEPRYMPKVVSVIHQPNPTAVLIGRHNSNAYIANLDGKINIFRLGALITDAPASAGDVTNIGMVQVGRNPTSMQTLRWGADPLQKDVTNIMEQNSLFVVCCRGDRELDWVRVRGNEGQVYRRIRDARMVDPVVIDVCEREYIVSVADFKGRKVINYRIGPSLREHVHPVQSFGCGPEGKDDFECGGVMDFPGFVYDINTANVN
jgi:hypothetical protein